MFRFLAICWNTTDVSQSAAARALTNSIRGGIDNWETSVEWNGCAIYVSGIRTGQNDAQILSGNAGAILGKVFSKNPERAGEFSPAILGARETDSLRVKGAAYLIENFWGRYIALWRDPSGRSLFVLRDPSGTFPCFETIHQGLHVYFSWLPDCIKLTGARFSVDWRFMTALLPLAIVQGRSTALREVTQLLAGECAEVTPGGVTKTLHWDPHRIAQTDVIEDPGVAAAMLRETTRCCVWAWASCYRGILHRLSGGLDSSIVLACLKDSPSAPHITGLTHYSKGAHSDERGYARAAARSTSIEIVECEQPEDVNLERLLSMAAFPFPRSCIPAIQSDRLEAKIAERCGADAVFGGGGGDQVFYQGYLSFAAIDYVQRRGLGPGLLSVSLSAARAERTSMWFVLRDALKDGIRRKAWHPMEDAGRYRQLLAPGVAEAARGDVGLAHPWFDTPNRSPIGKTFHIFTLSSPADYYNLRGHSTDAEYVHPIWSQPLLELVLRIPTYVLTSGGWDRALARRAFAADLPEEIIKRRTKGALDQHLKTVVRKHLPMIRELLLDGCLVEQGLLDRKKLFEVLTGRPTSLASPTVELFDYISAESWVRSWRKMDQAVAA